MPTEPELAALQRHLDRVWHARHPEHSLNGSAATVVAGSAGAWDAAQQRRQQCATPRLWAFLVGHYNGVGRVPTRHDWRALFYRCRNGTALGVPSGGSAGGHTRGEGEAVWPLGCGGDDLLSLEIVPLAECA